MSSLWTPDGERPVRRQPAGSSSDAGPPSGGGRPSGGGPRSGGGGPGSGVAPADDDLGELTEEEAAAQLEELRRQLVATPAGVVVANHAYGMFELAAIHLSEQPARLEEARLAVDGMAALVEGLAGRLGEAEPALKEALAQIRLAFVQIAGVAASGDGGGEGAGEAPAAAGGATD